jgi:hypothetical protein
MHVLLAIAGGDARVPPSCCFVSVAIAVVGVSKSSHVVVAHNPKGNV